MTSLGNKDRKLLELLSKGQPLIARFDHGGLSWLVRRGLADSTPAYAPDGKMSAQTIYSITEPGRCWLARQQRG